MINVDNIKNSKPKLSDIKEKFSMANTLLKCYKYFYIQCCDNDELAFSTEPYDFVVWNFGFIIDDISSNQNNMVVYKNSDFATFTDNQIQNILDELESNAILILKKQEEQNKLEKIKKDFE